MAVVFCVFYNYTVTFVSLFDDDIFVVLNSVRAWRSSLDRLFNLLCCRGILRISFFVSVR